MEILRVSFIGLVIATAAEAQMVIYPGDLDHTEGDTCNIRSSGQGICSDSAHCSLSPNERRTNPPPPCGVKDGEFLICCNASPGNPTETLTDISPPTVAFQCGRNAINNVFLDLHATGERLRAGAPPPPPDTGPFPGIPGITNEEIAEESRRVHESLPDGVFAAIGGVNADKNAWPWMALVGERDNTGNITWFCGGVLINEQWVLSAHHCFLFLNPDVVRLGEHNYNDDFDRAPHQDFDVSEISFYPEYAVPKAYHDLALLRLVSRVTIQEFMSPVCLPWGRESDSRITGQKMTLTGWGDTQYGGHPSSILQEVNVTVFPSTTCDRSYSNLRNYQQTWPQGISEETLCAGDPAGGRDACQGDSGGPLVSQDARGRFVLAGIISKGYGCGHKEYPGLFVNLRQGPYLAWIKNVAFGPQ